MSPGAYPQIRSSFVGNLANPSARTETLAKHNDCCSAASSRNEGLPAFWIGQRPRVPLSISTQSQIILRILRPICEGDGGKSL
jgi:hypothetical protein